MRWPCKKAQPKSEHPNTFPDTPCKGTCEGEENSLPISPYTGQPYDPSWGYQPFSSRRRSGIIPPRGGAASIPVPRVDPDLISKVQR